MKTSDWLAVAGLVASLTFAGAAGWVQLAARISSMEEHLRNKEQMQQVMRQVMIETMKDVHELKGMHAEHKHTGGAASDGSVMAETWLNESEM